jgi:hypothetical protein
MLELGINEATRRAVETISDEGLSLVIFDVMNGFAINSEADQNIWDETQRFGLNFSPEGFNLPVDLRKVSQELFRIHSATFIRLLLRYSGVDRNRMVYKTSDEPEYRPGDFDMTLMPITPDTTAGAMATANKEFYNIATQLVGLAATTGSEFGQVTRNANLTGYKSAVIIADRFGMSVDSPDQLVDRFVEMFSDGEGSVANILQDNESFGRRCPAHKHAGYDFLNRVYSSYAEELKMPDTRSRFIQRVRV